ncbi:MAG TPA: ammonia-forming cytochrome c nitrite reductase subunit c552 [Bryobacteraceae bacterium]|nr:ammonia-forming cytochrome c nitrite reductase subunit c552 [Bryobacteraceae bacterium]
MLNWQHLSNAGVNRTLGFLLLLGCSVLSNGQAAEGFTGSDACTECHAAIHRDWSESRHSRMMQPAGRASVQGNFQQGRLTLHGSPFVLRASNGAYYITESELSGKPWEHRVEYTLGDRRVQHYLTKLPDGRIVLLPPTWDTGRKEWVSEGEIENPEEAPGNPFQVWNKSCYGCHVSREQKNFDPEHKSYRTTWQNLGVDCESCHGPGAAHIAAMAAGKKAKVPARPAMNRRIVNPARLDATRSTMVCAPCHSYRDIYADGFQAGDNYYDFFLPVMEYRWPESRDPPFWADGRPRWLSNEVVALWQSQCFLKGGATCVTCHAQTHNTDVGRNPQLRADRNALCTKCHKAIGADLAAHTHHSAASAGSSCVECHMPATVIGLKARIRDHSIGVPVPENAIRHGIPNACNVCHRNKDAPWAARQVSAWYGGQSGLKKMLRADAFSQARKGDPGAIPVLRGILADASQGGWVRANAAGYLGGFPNDPVAYDAVLGASSDSDPLVRATAAMSLRPGAGQRPVAASALSGLLSDPARTVRVNAAIALVSLGVKQIPGDNGPRFESAKQLYRARAAFNADDPQYVRSQALLAEVEANEHATALNAEAEAKFREGQSLYQNEYYGAALDDMEQALKLDPLGEWTAKAQVYRAICLEKLARTGEAEAAMQALAARPGAMEDLDLQLAYVGLLYDTGRAEEALKRIEQVTAALPKAPLAWFWRAKVLVQLDRAAEAAAAAEQSVRLLPDFPQAHNLLIRIYQKQGRSREAAQEAAWLRDYERRVKSR